MNKGSSFTKHFIRYALQIGALELVPEGRKLKSGRVSPYFFNSGLFDTGGKMESLVGGYVELISSAYASLREGLQPFDILYGPPYKGTLLVPAIAMVLTEAWYRQGEQDIRFCSSRKEVKTHGDGGLLIGSPIKPGDKVLIVDDVITDGGTKREAVEFVRSFGGIPVGLAIAFDRQERGVDNDLSATQEFELEYGIPVHSIAGLSDLIDALKEMPEKTSDSNNSGILEKILAYQKEYGVTTV